MTYQWSPILPASFTFSIVTGVPTGGYWTTTVITGGGDLIPGVYVGWCIEKNVSINQGTHTGVPTDPVGVDDVFNKIAWVINYRTGYTATQTQNVIWYLQGAISYASLSAEEKILANSAVANGTGFIPGIGQSTIINADVPGKQRTTFEYKVEGPTPTLTIHHGDGDDADGCEAVTDIVPPACLVQSGDKCFRYRWVCVAGAWVLDYAQCVDNSLCGVNVLQTCTNSSFTFEAQNACWSTRPTPTPGSPLVTNACFPRC